MFYRIVRLLTLAAFLYSLVMCVGLLMGWFGLEKVLFTLQLVLVTTGLYTFYQSRPALVNNKAPKLLMMIVHILALPVFVLGALCISSEALAKDYWYKTNLVMIVFLGMVMLMTLMRAPLRGGYKSALVLLGLAYTIVILMHMSGTLSNGSLVFYGAMIMVILTVIGVFLGSEKKISSAKP